MIKKFNVLFKSKKTVHPLGDVEHEYIVSAATKKNAGEQGLDLLLKDEPDAISFYKSPVVSRIEATKPELEPELEPEPELKPEPELEPEPEPEPEIKPDKLKLDEKKPKEEEAEKALTITESEFGVGRYDIPNNIYHGANGISSSMLKKASQSMMLYHNTYIHVCIEEPKKEAFIFGNLFHTFALEPEKYSDEYICLDAKLDRRTKVGKAAYADVLAEAEENGKMIVTEDQFNLAYEMAGNASVDKYAGKLLRSPVRQTEVSIFDIHPTTGLMVKVRPDLIVGDVCVDLKSIHVNRAVDSEWMLEHIRREILKYKYHLSAAMYLEVAKLKEFVWIFVNKASGYNWVATIKASEELLEEGSDLYHTNMHRIFDAAKNDEWPGPSSILPTVHNGKVILPEI